jgi:hypothetical protein
MKLSVVRGGGLAGVVTRTELATEAMPSKDADTLHDKVTRAGLLEGDQEPSPAPSHPDELSYELTVEHAGRHRTVRMTEGSMPEAVRTLLAWADARPESRTTIERPGGRRGPGTASAGPS